MARLPRVVVVDGGLAHLLFFRSTTPLRLPHPLRFSKGGYLDRLRYEAFPLPPLHL
jgi:hypothetical protein